MQLSSIGLAVLSRVYKNKEKNRIRIPYEKKVF